MGVVARSLSPVELEVLRASARGETAEETAVSVHRAVATVKHHRRHVIAKLSARNITHAVAIAYETGLLGERKPPVEPMSPGQVRAFYAKCSRLDAELGLFRGTTARAELDAAAERSGRDVDDATDLTSMEAHEILTTLESRLRGLGAGS